MAGEPTRHIVAMGGGGFSEEPLPTRYLGGQPPGRP